MHLLGVEYFVQCLELWSLRVDVQCNTSGHLPGRAERLKTLPQEMAEMSWNDGL